jgi:hypothetical protein
MRTRCFLAAGLLASSIALGAHAASFGSPIQLSQNGHAATVSVGVDGAGNALATWADAGMFYSDRPAGGSWSAPQSVYVGGAFPVMRMTADGSATIVSYSSLNGIWSVDRPHGGAWTSPALLVNAPDIVGSNLNNVAPLQFLSNARGDQAIVFQQLLGGQTVISVLHRSAGGSWSAQDNAASSADYGDIAFASSAMGGNGDVVVTFETYQVVCNKYCHDVNYAVHAVREKAGTTSWADSGALTPQSSAYNTKTIIDSSGHAGILLQDGFSATIQATTQQKAGAPWSVLTNAFESQGQDGAQLWLAEAGKKGDASLAFVYLGQSGAYATVLDGKLTNNSWSAANELSLGDNPGTNDNMVFDSNAKGGAVAEWTDIDGTVRASMRKKFTGAWSAPQTLTSGSACNVGGVVCTGAVASSVNATGKAVVAYIRFDPTVTYSTLFVSGN